MVMVAKDDVWFRYTDFLGRTQVVLVASVRFWPDVQEVIFSPRKVAEGKIHIVRCRCGSNDWNDDGRWLGEYCCAGCGQYIQIFEKRD